MHEPTASRRVPLLHAQTSATLSGGGATPVKRKGLGEIGRRWTMATSADKSLVDVDVNFDEAAFAAISRPILASEIEVVAPMVARLAKRAGTVATLVAPKQERADEEGGADDSGKQTNGEAIVNLLNNCLGSGMLTMGYAFSKAGILPSLATMAASAYLNRKTLLLNLDSCRLAECDPASAALGEKTFGRAGRVGLVALYTTFAFLCCVSYVTATADSLTGILTLALGAEPERTPLLVAAWALLLLPTTLVRSLKAVAALSFVAFVGGCVMLLAVSAYCARYLLFEHGFPDGFPDPSLRWLPPSCEALWFDPTAARGSVKGPTHPSSPATTTKRALPLTREASHHRPPPPPPLSPLSRCPGCRTTSRRCPSSCSSSRFSRVQTLGST